MEEDCTHSGKSHFNASARWSFWHYALGIPSVVLSTAAGAAFFKDFPIFAGSMTLCVAVLTSLMTFLKPGERAEEHKNAGDQYLALRNSSRVFREIELAGELSDEAAVEALKGLTCRRDELNQASLSFSDADRRKARRGIEAGEALHVVDRENQ